MNDPMYCPICNGTGAQTVNCEACKGQGTRERYLATRSEKRDKIEISITGSKKFRQLIMDLVYTTLIHGEELESESIKAGNGFTLNSSIEPSEEVIE